MPSMIGTTELEIKVRLGECDPYGIAHNSQYFVWFEMGRFDYAEKSGYSINITELSSNSNIVYMTLNTKCKFLKSCKYGDEIIVKTRIEKPVILFAKYYFEQKICSKQTGEVLAKCWTENAAIDRKANRVLKVGEDKKLSEVE